MTKDKEHKVGEYIPMPKQEPVAFASHGVVNWIADKQFQHEAYLYSVPQRTWVGLTDEEIYKASTEAGMQEHYMGFHSGFIRFAQAIEAKLKEKNT